MYELIDCVTGRSLYKGSKERCLSHILNDPMTIVLHWSRVADYRAALRGDNES